MEELSFRFQGPGEHPSAGRVDGMRSACACVNCDATVDTEAKGGVTHLPRTGPVLATSSQYTGVPGVRKSSSPSSESLSTPMPCTLAASSLAMNTAQTPTCKRGFCSASCLKRLQSNATWPRQSDTPRPYRTSSSRISLKGSRFQVAPSAGTCEQQQCASVCL